MISTLYASYNGMRHDIMRPLSCGAAAAKLLPVLLHIGKTVSRYMTNSEYVEKSSLMLFGLMAVSVNGNARNIFQSYEALCGIFPAAS